MTESAALPPTQRCVLGNSSTLSPEFWLNLQKAYELDVARQQIGSASIPLRPINRFAALAVNPLPVDCSLQLRQNSPFS